MKMDDMDFCVHIFMRLKMIQWKRKKKNGIANRWREEIEVKDLNLRHAEMLQIHNL